MKDPDRIYFSDFVVDPEFESIYEYDDLCDFDFRENSDYCQDNSGSDDPDDLAWDIG